MNSTISPMFFTIGIIVFICTLVFIGWFTTRKQSESGTSFLKGGVGINIFLLLGTMAATCIGTGSSIGATATGFSHGWAGSLVGLGNGVGMLCMIVFCHTWKHQFADLPEEIEYYYGGSRTLRRLLGFLFTIAELIWVSNAINGGSKFLTFITGMDVILCKLLISLGFMGYAIFGGYLSVVVTDTIQMVIILGGFFIVVIRAVMMAGGPEGIAVAYTVAENTGALKFVGYGSYGTMAALTLFITSFYNIFASTVIHQRLYTSSSTQNARKVYLTTGIIVILFSLLPSISGMAAFAIASNSGVTLAEADHAFVFLATTVLHPFMGLLFLISGLSAILSSADSNLMACILCFFNDVLPGFNGGKAIPDEKYKFWVRVSICVGVIVAFFISIFATDVITFLLTIFGSLVPALGVTLILGRFWRRATWQGGVCAAAGGAILGCINIFVPTFRQLLTDIFGGPTIPVTLVALMLGIVVSLSTKREERSEEEVLAIVRSYKKSK